MFYSCGFGNSMLIDGYATVSVKTHPIEGMRALAAIQPLTEEGS